MRALLWRMVRVLLSALLATPAVTVAQIRIPQPAPPDTVVQSLTAIRVPVSFTLRPMTTNTMGIKLRVAGTFAVRNLENLQELDLGGFRTNAILAGTELLIPLHEYRTLRPFLDMGVGHDRTTDETVFLIEAGMLAEFIFPWRSLHFSLEPAIRYNGKSGNELGASDDQVNGLLHGEVHAPLPIYLGGQKMFGGIYAETGYFLNSLDFIRVSGGPDDAQSAFELGVTTGFYDIRPKIWFITLPKVSLGYRFRGSVSGLRLRIGGDWATTVGAP